MVVVSSDHSADAAEPEADHTSPAEKSGARDWPFVNIVSVWNLVWMFHVHTSNSSH